MTSLFVDTHTHIDSTLERSEYTKDFHSFRQEVICCEQCEKFIHISCEPTTLDVGWKIINENDEVFGAFGIHPHEAQHYTDEVEAKLREYITKGKETGKVVGFGEIGLDYHYNLSEQAVQKDVFIRQIKLALTFSLPIVLHLREADEDALHIIREYIPKDTFIHLHCYTSLPSLAASILAEYPHAYVGITGVVTFKSATNTHEVVKATPLNRLLLETDAPYMAPIPFRGKTCHSGMIPKIAEKIAALKGVAIDEVYTQIRQNTRDCYKI
ncbi:putative D-aminoacyl-tRNA deacylase [Blattamonas nauphoetae]|uniref:D-aminoacyl-tRNA deacylase n=1 Tax=Blattamonas nauphoetae TaxID=2049346 RepID=A0ABQ9Y1P5_9EUKA|nr:putative D-aminoacyl-tRNA deacylase [Blattamonas nauphoetae]